MKKYSPYRTVRADKQWVLKGDNYLEKRREHFLGQYH